MRVLLDEDLPIRLRLRFSDDVAVETVEYRGWKGFENGELLRAAEAEFDVFVTMDDHLPEQQNLPELNLAVVILKARSKRLEDLSELIPQLERKLPALQPGEVVWIRQSAQSS